MKGTHNDGNRMKPTPLIALALPKAYSVQMARFYVRATLTYHDLSG